MTPILDYVYGREVTTDTGVVSNVSIEKTRQKYEVIAVGKGKYEFGTFIEPSVKPGDIVFIQKHASEGDAPPDMLDRGYALFQASRIMAIEEKK